MAQNVVSDGTHILGHHIAAMLDESIGTGGLGQIDAGTWAATEGNQVAELLEIITVGIACGKYDVGNILLYLSSI